MKLKDVLQMKVFPGESFFSNHSVKQWLFFPLRLVLILPVFVLYITLVFLSECALATGEFLDWWLP